MYAVKTVSVIGLSLYSNCIGMDWSRKLQSHLGKLWSGSYADCVLIIRICSMDSDVTSIVTGVQSVTNYFYYYYY